MKPYSERVIQKRRFFLVLPILVTPFMTMFFWALGGGKGVATMTSIESDGLNTTLPDARFDDEVDAWNKLSLYQKAKRDSLKAGQAKRNDPYFRLSTLKVTQDTSKRKAHLQTGAINSSLGERKEPLDATEAKIYKKLAELQKEIDKPASGQAKSSQAKHQVAESVSPSFQNDIDRLESMMLMMQNDPAQDEEMDEINAVLNKILDIQHPDRVERRQALAAGAEEFYPARPDASTGEIGLIGGAEGREALVSENRFYGLTEPVVGVSESNSIKAEIYGNQSLVSGSVIKMELLQDISVNGVHIPKNQFVFGVCALNGDRLTVKVSAIRYNNSILPVSLSVFDIDGLEGIYVPGAIARDAAKKSSNQAIQGMQLSTLDPSIEAQAATAGIEAAKGMLSKKTRLIQVTVKAGYKVLLKDKNSK